MKTTRKWRHVPSARERSLCNQARALRDQVRDAVHESYEGNGLRVSQAGTHAVRLSLVVTVPSMVRALEALCRTGLVRRTKT